MRIFYNVVVIYTYRTRVETFYILMDVRYDFRFLDEHFSKWYTIQ